MTTERKKVSALAALIVATGVAAVALGQGPAQADPVFPHDAASYTAWRIDAAFDAVAAMPQVAAVMVPMADKGDLPIPLGCVGIVGDAQSECMDVAYEMDSVPSAVVESREGTTSTLLKLDPMTLAVVTDQTLQQSE